MTLIFVINDVINKIITLNDFSDTVVLEIPLMESIFQLVEPDGVSVSLFRVESQVCLCVVRGE